MSENTESSSDGKESPMLSQLLGRETLVNNSGEVVQVSDLMGLDGVMLYFSGSW
jgi:hypothetical protein